MLGIHIEEGNAKGWFGRGAASALLSIATLVLLVGGSAFGIFAAMSDRGGTNDQPNLPTVSATPAAPEPTSSTPISSTPSTTVTPTPTQTNLEGKVWTVEELISEFVAHPDKYKEGVVFQISGVYDYYGSSIGYSSANFRLGPPVNVYDKRWYGDIALNVLIVVEKNREKELFKTWLNVHDEDRVIIKGALLSFDRLPNKGVFLGDSALISVTPAK